MPNLKKILLALSMVSVSLMADFKAVGVEEFLKLQAKGAPVIDIRTPGEWKDTGIIKGAHKMMFFTPTGQPDVAGWFFDLGLLVKSKKDPIIIYCAHANRTKSLGEGLVSMGFENVYELKDGIENGWMKKGKKTVK